MTTECNTILAKKAANITAISIVSSSYDCDVPCTIDITVNWQNTGGRDGTFEPAIIVNGIRNGSGLSIVVNPSMTYQYIFTLSDLAEGTYTVCPDPN